MESVIYQASDLAGSKRTEFLEEARTGRARLRDKDGTSLVMLPERDLEVLDQFARWSRVSTHLSTLLGSGEEPTIVELGELGWLRVFDADDQRDFLDDLQACLLAALADNDVAVVDRTIKDWQTTARQLEDPLRRAVLLGRHNPSDFEDAVEPASK